MQSLTRSLFKDFKVETKNSQDNNEYTKINFIKLPIECALPVDVYLKISVDNFVLLYWAKEATRDIDYNKYHKNKVSHFYIKTKDLDKYINYFLKQLNLLLLSKNNDLYKFYWRPSQGPRDRT